MANYKCIMQLTNGLHKVVRMNRDQVAHLVSEIKKMRNGVFQEIVSVSVSGVKLCLNEIVSCKFVNEYTKEELLTV